MSSSKTRTRSTSKKDTEEEEEVPVNKKTKLQGERKNKEEEKQISKEITSKKDMETEEEEDVAANKKAKSEEEEERNKRQKGEEDKLNQELDDLKKNLAAVDKKLEVIEDDIRNAILAKDEKMKEDLKEQQAELKQQQANFQERIKNVKQELVAFPRPLTSKLKPFTISPVNEDMKFIPTTAFYDIKAVLLRTCQQSIPHGETRKFDFNVLRGPMGVGKTRTAWQAVMDVSMTLKGCIPCYVRLDHFLHRLREASSEKMVNDMKSVDILASLLLYGFTNPRVVSLEYSPNQIAGEIEKQIGKTKIILHLDEYQYNLEMAKKILYGCKYSLSDKTSKISVVPILSGIHDHNQFLDLGISLEPSNWRAYYVSIGALPNEELEEEFAKAIHISLPIFKKCNNLVVMFRDCGGFAHLVVTLIEEFNRIDRLQEKVISSGVLEEVAAKDMFNNTLHTATQVYGAARWHSLFSRDPSAFLGERNKDTAARNRNSFPTTRSHIEKLVLLALSRRPIEQSYQLGTVTRGKKEIPVTLVDCVNMGLIGTTKVENELVVVSIPLMAILVMNDICGAIPETAELKNPFLNDWQTLERAAMCSVYVQVAARDDLLQFSILHLRPGALAYFNDSVDIVSFPSKLDFGKFSTGLGAKNLKSGGSPSTLVKSLEIGQFWLTAPNQQGVDGLAILKGKLNEDDECTILWLSQSKKQDISLETGENSGSSLTNGPIRDKLIPKMRKIANQLKKRFPDLLKDAYVVYDIFTDRFGPKSEEERNGSQNDKKDSQAQVKTRGRKKVSNNQDVGKIIEYKPSDFGLKKREGLFITRNKHLDSVLAGLAARKRLIEN